MNFFKRLFKIGQAEANAAIDQMEDPIKMTEQGIRDLRIELEKSLESLAQVKALSIKANNEMEELQTKADDYEQKAILILQKVEKEELSIEEADKYAKDALIKKAETNTEIENIKKQASQFDESVSKLEQSSKEIKLKISKWENELKTLKARVKVSNATKNLNKQIAEVDSSNTVAMLERMKEKVAQEEALAEAYGDIAKSSKSIDDKLDEIVNKKENSAENNPTTLKEKLGMKNKEA